MNNTNEIKSRGEDRIFKSAKHRGARSRNVSCGLILTFLFSLADKISKKLRESVFGYICSDIYTYVNNAWTNGFIYGIFKRSRRGRVGFRASFARLCEESLISRLLSSASDMIIHSYLRIWGVATFAFSFTTVFVAMVRYYFTAELTSADLIIGAVLAVISIPWLASGKRVGEAMLDGKLSGYLMTRILCVDESRFERDDERSGGSYAVAFTWAALLGLITYFVSPLMIVHIFALGVIFALIMCYPELGITLVLGVLPFSNLFDRPTIAMLVLVSFSLLGFISKYIRGKRVARIEIVDVMVIAFGALILLGGAFGAGSQASLMSAAVYFVFLMMYMLVINSYIRKTWIYRGIKITVITTSVMALLGILQGGIENSSWVDMDFFSDIGGRVGSLFENPNMLGAYLVIVFPFVLAQMIVSKKKRSKMLYLFCVLSVLVCTVMTWTRGAWLGIIISAVVFVIVYDLRTVWILAAGAASAPLWLQLIPDNIAKRFLSIIEMSDSSVIYRFNTWRGVLNMISDNLFGGIGVGEDAFRAVFPIYSVAGTETVMHSHSLFLEILVEFGIVGALIFTVIMIMYVQKCFVGIKIRSRESKSRVMIAAGLSGICGALVMGMTDHIWYNYRVFLVFWAVAGLTMALVRINENENDKKNAAALNSVRAVEIDFYY